MGACWEIAGGAREGEATVENYADRVKAAEQLRDEVQAELEKARALLREAYDHGLNGDWMDRVLAFDIKVNAELPALPAGAEYQVTKR